MAACQSSSKYPTLTLYSAVWVSNAADGEHMGLVSLSAWKKLHFVFFLVGFLGLISFWCHFPVEPIESGICNLSHDCY